MTASDHNGGPLPSVLFLDKVFLKGTPDPLRGVELFNLNLVRDLMRLACPVTLVTEASWRKPVADFLHERMPERVEVGPWGLDVLNVVSAGVKLARRRHDVLLLGNVGNGIIPLVLFLHRMRVFSRCVLVAHREASPRFVRALRSMPCRVVAVNEKIAGPFRRSGYPHVAVDYGIFGSEQFTPDAGQRGAEVNFCVLGMLDNAWKGSDTAVEAFRLLPSTLRDRCALHLASFSKPPIFPEKNIVAHAWMTPGEIPGFLRRMDVMLCPSRDEHVMRETFSQAIVQGMLTALPVIAHDIPILAEKLDAGGGLLFRSTGELAGHMARLAENPDERRALGAQARRTALDRYVWDTERFARRYLMENA